MPKTTRYIGYCPVCSRDIKVRKGVLVHHGFERPGDGMGIIGDCFGALRVPHEVSPETATDWLAQVVGLREGAEERLAALPMAQQLPQWDYRKGRYVLVEREEVSEHVWRDLYLSRERALQQQISSLGSEQERVEGMLAAWEPMDLRTVQEEVQKKEEAKKARARAKRVARQEKAEKKIAYYRKQAASIAKKLPKVLAKYEADPKWENERPLRRLESRTMDLYFDAPYKLQEIFGYNSETGYAVSKDDARSMLELDGFFERMGVGPHTTDRYELLFPRIEQ